jgi:hypothetical protein
MTLAMFSRRRKASKRRAGSVEGADAGEGGLYRGHTRHVGKVVPGAAAAI